MSLTKMHFKAVAEIVRTQLEDVRNSNYTENSTNSQNFGITRIAKELAYYFSGENPEFDAAKFFTACGLDKYGNY